MCQEIHLSDLRPALLDYCEENDESIQLQDVLERLDHAEEYRLVHATDHRRRAKRFASLGDTAAASIHQALFANMARAAH
jgi:hypothetical protein